MELAGIARPLSQSLNKLYTYLLLCIFVNLFDLKENICFQPYNNDNKIKISVQMLGNDQGIQADQLSPLYNKICSIEEVTQYNQLVSHCRDESRCTRYYKLPIVLIIFINIFHR